jgi:hypothetical protein
MGVPDVKKTIIVRVTVTGMQWLRDAQLGAIKHQVEMPACKLSVHHAHLDMHALTASITIVSMSVMDFRECT